MQEIEEFIGFAKINGVKRSFFVFVKVFEKIFMKIREDVKAVNIRGARGES